VQAAVLTTLGHKDGTESAALSKKCSAALSEKRGPDERKEGEGPSDSRSKNEQGAARTSSTACKAAAPVLHPPVVKRPAMPKPVRAPATVEQM